MTDRSAARRPPDVWWRRALAAVDGLDVAFAAALLMTAAGLFILWGVGVALLGVGGIGLAGSIALLVRSDAAARGRD
ncbi:hypothetical protein [Salininema proteolyticum]|uniref:Uncharacterized protein n=1 Tax=Salininema proteolyticum TaxID=1607685 RepID=A0ABV8TTT0_9ACTN